MDERLRDVKTERRKEGVFFVRCRRTYVLNKIMEFINDVNYFAPFKQLNKVKK